MTDREHIYKASVNGNSNIGLYIYCNNDYALAGVEVPDKVVEKAKEILDVPVHQITIAGTSLVGVFLAGNSNCLLIPNIAFDHEIAAIEKLGINYKIINTTFTTLGNNLVCNDFGCVASTDFSAETKKIIKTALNVPVQSGTIAGLPTVGSAIAINSKGGIVHTEVSDNEMAVLQKVLQIELDVGTVNLGGNYLASGIVANDKGFLVGDISGGPEIIHIDNLLGFLEF